MNYKLICVIICIVGLSACNRNTDELNARLDSLKQKIDSLTTPPKKDSTKNNHITAIDMEHSIVGELLAEDTIRFKTQIIDSTVRATVEKLINQIDWSSKKQIGKRIMLGKTPAYLDIMPFSMLHTDGKLIQLNWEAESAYETDGESLIFQLYITRNMDSVKFQKLKNKEKLGNGKPLMESNQFISWKKPIFRVTIMQNDRILFWTWLNNLNEFSKARSENYTLIRKLYERSFEPLP